MPEPDALREASYFVERLAEERMPLGGLILNRVHSAGIIRLSAARSLAAAETLEAIDDEGVAPVSSASYSVTAAALRLHAERMNLGEREQRVAGSFMSTHPAVPVIEVPALPEDVHDLAGLVLNRVHIAGAVRLSAARSFAAAETLEAMQNGGAATASSASYPVTAAALRLHAERMNLGERERRVAGSFMSAHPAVPVVEVPAQPDDVHDLAGLRRVGEAFA